jgi:hypothetical protein
VPEISSFISSLSARSDSWRMRHLHIENYINGQGKVPTSTRVFPADFKACYPVSRPL